MVQVAKGYLNYGTTNTDSTTWVALNFILNEGTSQAACPADVSMFQVFDSSGSLMDIGVGDGTALGTRTIATIAHGGSFEFPQIISKGAKVWIRNAISGATNADASTYINVNYFHGRN